jgi:hypothetical protein
MISLLSFLMSQSWLRTGTLGKFLFIYFLLPFVLGK